MRIMYPCSLRVRAETGASSTVLLQVLRAAPQPRGGLETSRLPCRPSRWADLWRNRHVFFSVIGFVAVDFERLQFSGQEATCQVLSWAVLVPAMSSCPLGKWQSRLRSGLSWFPAKGSLQSPAAPKGNWTGSDILHLLCGAS